MKIAVAQIDTTVGDFAGNSRKILELGRRAETRGRDLVLFPELAVCGYPPRDLVERRAFIAESERAAARIARATGRGALALRLAASATRAPGPAPVFNAARSRRAAAGSSPRTASDCCPTYDVFDEGRYIEPGRPPARAAAVAAQRIGVTICEDIWNDKTFWKHPLYPTDPVGT